MKIMYVAGCVAVAGMMTFGDTVYWEGGIDDLLETGGNWSNGTGPEPEDKVFFSGAGAVAVRTLASPFTLGWDVEVEGTPVTLTQGEALVGLGTYVWKKGSLTVTGEGTSFTGDGIAIGGNDDLSTAGSALNIVDGGLVKMDNFHGAVKLGGGWIGELNAPSVVTVDGGTLWSRGRVIVGEHRHGCGIAVTNQGMFTVERDADFGIDVYVGTGSQCRGNWLDVSTGGKVLATCDLWLGHEGSGGANALRVYGKDSEVSVGRLLLGYGSDNGVEVWDSAALMTGDMIVGAVDGSVNNTVTLRGEGAWASSWQFILGQRGASNKVHVVDGAKLLCTLDGMDIKIGENPGADHNELLVADGSHFEGRRMVIGWNADYNAVTVTRGATAFIRGNWVSVIVGGGWDGDYRGHFNTLTVSEGGSLSNEYGTNLRIGFAGSNNLVRVASGGELTLVGNINVGGENFGRNFGPGYVGNALDLCNGKVSVSNGGNADVTVSSNNVIRIAGTNSVLQMDRDFLMFGDLSFTLGAGGYAEAPIQAGRDVKLLDSYNGGWAWDYGIGDWAWYDGGTNAPTATLSVEARKLSSAGGGKRIPLMQWGGTIEAPDGFWETVAVEPAGVVVYVDGQQLLADVPSCATTLILVR